MRVCKGNIYIYIKQFFQEHVRRDYNKHFFCREGCTDPLVVGWAIQWTAVDVCVLFVTKTKECFVLGYM